MLFLQKKYFYSQINFIVVFLIAAISFTGKTSIAQNINPSSNRKTDFVSQDEKEFIKIKELKVKTRLKYSVYYDIKGYMNDKKILMKRETFNKKGLLSEIVEYNSMGDVTSSYKFYYDAKGKPKKAEGVDENGNSNTQTSKYDSRGNEIERDLISIGRKRTETKSLFKYDKENNPIEVMNYANGKLTDRQYYEYKNGIRIKTTILNDKGDTAQVSIPEYDSSGKLMSEKSTTQNIVYKYDANGNLSEMTDAETKRTYLSDDKGNVIEHKMYLTDGRRQIRLVFKYNQKGLQSDWIRYDNNEDIILHFAYEYEYYK